MTNETPQLLLGPTTTSDEGVTVDISPSMKLRMAAAKLLRENGWCQHTFHHGEKHCIAGALMDANGTPEWYADIWNDEPMRDAIKSVAFEARIPWDQVAAWNDVSGRTKEQVIALLEGRDWEAE